jgi:hypothetical protein
MEWLKGVSGRVVHAAGAMGPTTSAGRSVPDETHGGTDGAGSADRVVARAGVLFEPLADLRMRARGPGRLEEACAQQRGASTMS